MGVKITRVAPALAPGKKNKRRTPKNTERLTLPALAVLALLLAFWPAVAEAASPLQVLLPYPAYDSAIMNPYDQEDASAQLLEAAYGHYKNTCGKNISIIPKPGRGGATAWRDLSDLEDDAYTLVLTDLPNLALLSLKEHPAYSLDDLRNICLIASSPLALWVPEESGLKELGELIVQAQNAPGQLIIAGPGSGTIQHLASLQLDRLAGMKTVYLPFTGDASAGMAAASGKAAAFWGHSVPLRETGKSNPAGQAGTSRFAAGRNENALKTPLPFRPLAVAAQERHPFWPDIPTFAELGYELVETSHFGLAISAKTNPKDSQAASAAFLNLARDKEFQRQISAAGFTPAPLGAFELRSYMQSLLHYYANQMQDFGLR